MPDALLLDLEMLADTRALRRASLAEALAAEGFERLATTLDASIDTREARSAAIATFAAAGIDPDETTLDLVVARAERAFASRLAAGVSLHRDLLEFVGRAMAHSRLALVTALRRADADRVLALAGLEHTFDVVVAAEDVAGAQQMAEAYELALRRLSRKRAVQVERCIAIEDRLSGVHAAHRAGLRVVATGAVVPHLALEAGAHGYVGSLESVTVDALAVLAGSTTRDGEPCP